jgi:hypothetical protein
LNTQTTWTEVIPATDAHSTLQQNYESVMQIIVTEQLIKPTQTKTGSQHLLTEITNNNKKLSEFAATPFISYLELNVHTYNSTKWKILYATPD